MAPKGIDKKVGQQVIQTYGTCYRVREWRGRKGLLSTTGSSLHA